MLALRITLALVVLVIIDYAVYRIRQRRHFARLCSRLLESERCRIKHPLISRRLRIGSSR